MRLVRRMTRLWTLPVLFFAVLTTAGSAATATSPFHHFRRGDLPKFVVTVDVSGWLQVRKFTDYHWLRAVRPPSPHFRRADAIVADIPDRAFIVTSSDPDACQSQLYRIRLSPDGQPGAPTPIPKSITQALVGDLAVSPDGSQIAFATKPCSDAATPHAAVTTLDLTTGHRRSWTLHTPSVVGDLTWGNDGHTLGYALGQLHQATTSAESTAWALSTGSARTLDTHSAAGLLDGAILYEPEPKLGTLESVWFAPDLHSGSATVDSPSPPQPDPRGDGTIPFTPMGDRLWMAFTKGHPARLVQRIKANEIIDVVSTGSDRRHECGGGIDAFDRFIEGEFSFNSPQITCSSAS